MRIITSLILSVVTVLSMAGAVVLPAPALAAASAGKSSACSALNQIGSGQGCGSNSSKNVLSDIVKTIVSILSYLLGAIAIIMVMIAGFKYITSNGDSNSIASAKNTLIYAIIGLIIAALAQFIVRFVLSKF